MKITEGKTVNLRDTVAIKGIKHEDSKKQKLQVGKEYKVQPLTAENLVTTGHAVYVDPKKQAEFEKANPVKKAKEAAKEAAEKI